MRGQVRLTMGLRSRARPGQRGAAIVEAAILLPLLVLPLTLGFIEIALTLKDYTAVSTVVRDAARIASSAPRQGNVLGHAGESAPGAQPSFAYLAAEVIESSGSALPKDSIVDLWVYKANLRGYPTKAENWKTDTNTSMADPSEDCDPRFCVRYAWQDPPGPEPGYFGLASAVVPGSGVTPGKPWDPATINACPSTVPATLAPTNVPDGESVGVFLRVERRGVSSAFFDGTMTLTDRSVIKFEPRSPTSCK